MIDKWDRRFIELAEMVAEYSKDPRRKVGCIIVIDKRIVSQGYNGFPAGILDSPERLNNKAWKLDVIIHAEVNAILNAAKNGASTYGSTFYTTFSPCSHCSSAIIQSGAKRVISPPIPDCRRKENLELGRDLLSEAGIKVIDYLGETDVN